MYHNTKVYYNTREFPSCDGWPSQLGLQNTLTASLQKGKTLPNECLGYDTKQSDVEASAILQLWGMWSAPSLSWPPAPLWPGVVAEKNCLTFKP